MEDEITLSFPNHHQNLVVGLWNYFLSWRGVDLDVQCCDGRTIRAHHMILDLFLSPEKLYQSAQQHGGPIEFLLVFLYKGKVTIRREQLGTLLNAARESDFKVLVDVLESGKEVEHEITLNFPNHHQNLVVGLWNYFLSCRGVDFDVQCCDGRTIRAHHMILDLFLSPEKLYQSAQQHGGPIEFLLEFLYKGKVTIRREQLGTLLNAARESDFKVLVNVLESGKEVEHDSRQTVMSPNELLPDSGNSVESPRNWEWRAKNIKLEPCDSPNEVLHDFGKNIESRHISQQQENWRSNIELERDAIAEYTDDHGSPSRIGGPCSNAEVGRETVQNFTEQNENHFVEPPFDLSDSGNSLESPHSCQHQSDRQAKQIKLEPVFTEITGDDVNPSFIGDPYSNAEVADPAEQSSSMKEKHPGNIHNFNRELERPLSNAQEMRDHNIPSVVPLKVELLVSQDNSREAAPLERFNFQVNKIKVESDQNVDADVAQPQPPTTMNTPVLLTRRPPKRRKRQSIGRSTVQAQRRKALRASETDEQHEARLEAERLRTARARSNETIDQRKARLEAERLRTAQVRFNKTIDQREARLEADRLRIAQVRSNETIDQRAARLEAERLRTARVRSNETIAQRKARLEAERLRTARVRSNETIAQRKARLEAERLRTAEVRSNETIDQREARLEAERLRTARVRSNETINQRKARLEANRLRIARVRSNETIDQREARLEADRLRTARIRSNKIMDQWEARLEALNHSHQALE